MMQDNPEVTTAPTMETTAASKTESPLKEAKVIKLDFIAKPNGAYEIKENGSPKEKLIFNKNDDDINGKKMKKEDYYLIEFTLVDQSGLSLSFAPGLKEVLWVRFGPESVPPPPCPTEACYSDEFYAVSVDQNGKKLTVHNEDSQKAEFSFTLRFLPEGADPTDPSNYVDYDPVGSNQIGGR